MKKVLCLVMMVMVCSVAMAGQQSEGTNWRTPSQPLNNFLNKYAPVEVNVPDKRSEIGLYFDVEYILNDSWSVGCKNTVDFNNTVNRTDDRRFKYPSTHYVGAKYTFGK